MESPSLIVKTSSHTTIVKLSENFHLLRVEVFNVKFKSTQQ